MTMQYVERRKPLYSQATEIQQLYNQRVDIDLWEDTSLAL